MHTNCEDFSWSFLNSVVNASVRSESSRGEREQGTRPYDQTNSTSGGSDSIRRLVMFIYVGTLNWLTNAINETFTLVIAKNIVAGDPVLGYYQWTVDANGAPNWPVSFSSQISELTTSGGERRFTVATGYYKCEAVLGLDPNSTMMLTMSNAAGGISRDNVFHLHYVLDSSNNSNSARSYIGVTGELGGRGCVAATATLSAAIAVILCALVAAVLYKYCSSKWRLKSNGRLAVRTTSFCLS
jgi:hypothetical protein